MPFPRSLARAIARTPALVRGCLRARAVALVALVIAAAAATSFGATSNVIVSMDVPSALQLTNSCSSTAATSLGTVLPGTGATTDTGAGRCIVSWASSNNSSMLRISQRDNVGTAMSRPSGFSGTTDWNHWTSLDTADGSNAIAGGDGGTFGRTANSGGLWTVTNNLGGINSELTDVEQVPLDATGAWAVGYSGRVQRVTNALGVPGVTNRRAQLEAAGWPVWANVTEVGVVDLDTAFVGGDSGWMAKTDNDGATWTAFQFAGTNSVQSIQVAPTGDVWVATRGNAGGNFFRAPIATGTLAAHYTQYASAIGITIQDIHVSGAGNGYAVGASGSIYSWNGAAWTFRGDDNMEGGELIGVASPSGQPGYAVAVGVDGSLLRTVNGGVNWARIQSPTGSILIAIASGSAGMLSVGTGRTTISSTDGLGATWGWISDSATARGRRAVALEPVDGTIALAVGTRGTIWRSTDGGSTWGTVTSGTTQPLFGVTWASRTIAWAVGGNGTMLRSTDAGATWSTMTSNTTVRLMSVSSGGPEHVLAGGDDGTYVRSANGGTTFAVSTIAAGAPTILEVSMGSRLVGTLVGDDLVLRTSDGGATWVAPATSPAAERLTGVSMANASSGFATSSWDAIWRTVDGGANWTRVLVGSGNGKDVHAVTSNVAFIAGDSLWRTLDGGTTWTQVTNPSWDKASVTAGDENHVIIGGEVGAILVSKSSTAGADQIPDYGAAPNSWATSAQAMFGVCLQAVGAQTTQAAPWVVDGGTCTGSDADPWRALPMAPTKIAGVPITGNTGQVELVFGARFPDAQAPGRYSAGVVFEAVAPNA